MSKKPSVGRPPEADVARTEKIYVRFTPNELARLKKIAGATKPGPFLRELALGELEA